ncbi:hypothetical protein GGF50DRAFT_109909 [Schizophyllum commune]
MVEVTNLAYEPEFPHPFVDRSQYDEEPKGTWAPRAILELRMYQLSATLREKPEWWRKAKDPEIRQKWFEEAKAQQEKDEKRWKLSDNMINYTLGELEDYARLRDEETGIECGPYECIWRSDKLIPDDLRTALRAAVAPLEDVPEDKKDWHPGSNKQVLDLVHPSLYPLVYGKTLGKQPDGSIGTFAPPLPSCRSPGDPLVEYGLQDAEVLSSYISPRFQWLPSDFEVREDGSVRLASSYVNNVPPEHAPRLVPVLERIVARAVPMWERVLGDLRRGEPKMRLGPVVESDSWVGASKGLDCVWRDGEPEDPPEEDEYYDSNNLDWETYKARRDAWFAGKPMALPEAPGEYDGRLVEGRETFSLRGRSVQVITKLANIVLGPDNPTYPGGTWHVEGMWNERIVSTFIYYYESENIQDTTLAFRQATAEPLYHQQDDVFCMWTLYRMERDRPCVQDIGSIQTKEGRCIAFPNLFQHKVSPFNLTDPTKPGVRKILALFLVDSTRPVPSATEIAPQQKDWVQEALYGAQLSPTNRLSTLPTELITTIEADLTPMLMSREEAEAVRAELMEERSVKRDEEGEVVEGEGTLFSGGFNMCEH